VGELLIVIGVMFAGLIGFELLARTTNIPQSLMRKIIHIGMCLLVIGFSFLFDYKIMVATGFFFVLVLLVARKVFDFHSLRDRHGESWGEIFFPLGIGLGALVASTHGIFIAAMLILALSDTIAFMVGRRYPKSRQIVPHRTIAGSGAGFIMSLVILIALHIPFGFAVLAAFVVAVAEIMSQRGLDNTTMPVVAAAALSFLL